MSDMIEDDFNYNILVCNECGRQYDFPNACECSRETSQEKVVCFLSYHKNPHLFTENVIKETPQKYLCKGEDSDEGY